MKKKQVKQLVLAKETVQALAICHLEHAAGAQSGPVNCFTTVTVATACGGCTGTPPTQIC